MGKDVLIKDLRDTLCHSFVSCDLQEGDDSVIAFDDRLVMSRVEHDKLVNTKDGSKCITIKNEIVLEFLK